MVLIPLILNYGINTNAMEIARFALPCWTKLVKEHQDCNQESRESSRIKNKSQEV